jgi:hypothetical protein
MELCEPAGVTELLTGSCSAVRQTDQGRKRVSEKYLSFAENHYVNAIVGLLLIFTVSEEIIESWKSGISNFEMQAEHGLFFLYLNLFLISTARICKAYVYHRKARRTNSGEIN